MAHPRTLAFALALCMPLAAGPALGQSAEQIVEALMPPPAPAAAPAPGLLKRSFVPRGREVSRGIAVTGKLAPAPPPSINLTINFEFDSARLTNDGWIALQALGAALKDQRLAGMRFRIAGHTDGRGNAAYNQALSERRAITVASHLAQYYSIPPALLVPVGFGESQLIDPYNPARDINRRVEITNLTPTS